jgi:hypothetical protein
MPNSKEIRTADLGGAADLLCPRCDADYLHHGKVVFYDRAEDADTVTRITVEGNDIEVVHRVPNSGNPSRRRHGMTIEFMCEQCSDQGPILLTLAQHKGATEIGWKFD